MQQTINSVNYLLRDKLLSLVSFLSKATKEFDTISEEIDSSNLKMAMMTMAVDCKQYAKEISKELDPVLFTNSTYSDQVWEQIEESLVEEAILARGSEVAVFCNNAEMFFNKIYEDVLKEFFPYENLKNLITYQLFSIRCAFMKMRLLNTIRFSQ